MFLAACQRESLGPGGIAAGMGISIGAGSGAVDWAGLKQRRDAYVRGLTTGYESGWKKAGAEVIVGEASFEDRQTIRVKSPDGSSRQLKAKNICVAVGGVPAPLNVPGGELAINSDGFFDLEKQPKKVAVIGAGYIAVELAGIFHGLGSEAHLFFRGATVLRHGFDPYIVETLMDTLTHHGPKLHKQTSPARLFRAADGTITLVVTTATGMVEEHTGFDCVLSAIGRTPSTGDSLGLKLAGVETDSNGYIVVDKYENTTAPGVCALGDVTTTGYELTPVAIAAGRRLADRLFGGEALARIDYACIATVVFSHPPIGCIGLTEPQAREEFGDKAITVKQARFGSMLYALNAPDAKVKTALKLVLCGPEEKVVGLHCIGPGCDEMMQGFALAVRMGATRADFEASVAIHPTIAEEFVTFGGWGQTKGDDGKLMPQLPPYLQQPTKFSRAPLAAAVVAAASVIALVVMAGRRS